jgi:hypothetical protein
MKQIPKITLDEALTMLSTEEKRIYRTYVMFTGGFKSRTTFYNRAKEELTLSQLDFLHHYFGYQYSFQTGELTRVHNKETYRELNLFVNNEIPKSFHSLAS